MTQVRLAGLGIDRERRLGDTIVRAVHSALGGSLATLLDWHGYVSVKFSVSIDPPAARQGWRKAAVRSALHLRRRHRPPDIVLRRVAALRAMPAAILLPPGRPAARGLPAPALFPAPAAPWPYRLRTPAVPRASCFRPPPASARDSAGNAA